MPVRSSRLRDRAPQAGDFAEVTLGWPFGHRRDGGLPPYWLYPYGE
ncbi:hypothetical protein ACF1DV_03565 [Streptomyces achromogenes]